MTLSFSQKWPKSMPKHMAGQHTLFPLKVLKSLEQDYPEEMQVFKMKTFFNYGRFAGFTSEVFQKIKPKKHTIREDKSQSWVPGRDIHYVINNRSKDRYRFAPIIPCVSVQSIKIEYDPAKPIYPNLNVIVSTGNGSYKILGEDSIKRLAINDGFETLEDFFAWFNKDFTGKIIHWTKLKY